MKNLNILIITFCIIVAGLWVVPKFSSLSEKQTTITNLQNQKADIIQQQKAVEEKLKQAENQNPAVQIPPTREQAILIRDLQAISQKTGFIFKSLNFGKGVNPDVGAEQTTISFSVLGLKEQAPLFLKNIEENERFLSMETLNVAQADRDGAPLVQMTVTLHAFSVGN